jgi:16S rRNA G966 N2-methylase RsmD
MVCLSGKAAQEAIGRNLAELGIEAELATEDALHFCGRASRAARQYDLIFLDPPYRHADELGDELTAALAPLLGPDGRVVAESDRRTPLELNMPLLDERRYGDTLIRIHGTH